MSARKVGAFNMGAPQVGIFEVRSGEIGSAEIGALQEGPGQIRVRPAGEPDRFAPRRSIFGR